MGKVLFSQVCVCPHPKGVPQSLVPGPFPASGPMAFQGEVPQSQVLSPVPRSFPGGTLSRFFPRSLVPGPFLGVTQPQTGGTPVLGRWNPSSRGLSWGVPQARTGLGYPLSTGQDWGTPLARTGLGKQSSRVSTCYVAGSMPLVFMQEDFNCSCTHSYNSKIKNRNK